MSRGGFRPGAGRKPDYRPVHLGDDYTSYWITKLVKMGDKALRVIARHLRSKNEDIQQKAAFKVVDKIIPQQLTFKYGKIGELSTQELKELVATKLAGYLKTVGEAAIIEQEVSNGSNGDNTVI